ncbi:hypothetical protein PIB30_034339 [Stylosanthes scabra]|uniref:Uncharacterized protein n=1 Tax=Stylosanthes scabra TaxID=79078 RepID=A0ABU6UCY2_9FABA|nr:hypothetical protein [Stylosanthes scabra]
MAVTSPAWISGVRYLKMESHGVSSGSRRSAEGGDPKSDRSSWSTQGLHAYAWDLLNFRAAPACFHAYAWAPACFHAYAWIFITGWASSSSTHMLAFYAYTWVFDILGIELAFHAYACCSAHMRGFWNGLGVTQERDLNELSTHMRGLPCLCVGLVACCQSVFHAYICVDE